jgi:PTH2 family peptidyl-tRNA hydrolase
MPPGKLAAQAGHAYTDALWACLDQAPDQALAYRTTGIGGSKVTIQSKNLGQLERAARECEAAGIPHAVVTDKDHVLLPHFTGAPIVTALGIGPVTQAQCRHITKRFQVVRGSDVEDEGMPYEARQALVEAMRACEQSPGLTVLQHGLMVRDHYRDLMDHLRYGSPLRGEWRLPEWIRDPRLLESLPSDEVMADYHVFHDCVIHTPQDASTQNPKGWSRLRVKTTMTITNADEDTSPDFRAMATATAIGRIMSNWNVEPEICFNSQGGIHLCWLGDLGQVEIGVEKDGWCDWTIIAIDGTIRTSDGLVDARTAASALTAFITKELATIAA